jgi:acyl carrier protein
MLSAETQIQLAEIRDLAADLFALEPAEVEAATHFVDDLGLDSLTAIDLLGQLEKHYDVSIPDSRLSDLINVRAAYDLVAEQKGW